MSEPRKPIVLPDWETRDRLNAALNEILTFGADHLPPGWEIRISMNGDHGGGQAWLELLNPDGAPRSEDWDGDMRNVWRMIEYVNNVHVEEPNNEDE